MQLLLPAIATAALGTALLVPLRDGRLGRRATLHGGVAPLRPDFGQLEGAETSSLSVSAATEFEAVTTGATQESAQQDDAGETRAATSSAEPASVVAASASANVTEDIGDDGKLERNAGTSYSEASSGASLLEPLSALMTIAMPFVAVARRCLSFSPAVRTPSSQGRDSGSVSQESDDRQAPANVDAGREDVDVPSFTKERSFAAELSKLLHSRNDRVEEVDNRTAIGEDAVDAERSEAVFDLPPARPESAANAPLERRAEEATAPIVRQEIVVAVMREQSERIVPLTRLPLRTQSAAFTWPYEFASERSDISRAERHALLDSLLRRSESPRRSAIELAYQEEDPAGRALALRIAARHFPTAGRALFAHALRYGSDDERYVAIDALTAIGAREELRVAFGDRLEALAARAALGYVGTVTRSDYCVALADHVDGTRLEAILSLLAGIVE